MAISPDYDGKFDPAAVKTIPDVKDVAPNLTPRDSVAFIKGATTIVSVRLWINGKPAFSGKTPPRVAKTETPAAQPEATAEMPAEVPKETVATATPTPAPAPAPVRDGAPAAVAGDVKGTKIARRQTSIHGLVVMSTDTGAMLGGTSDLILTATPGDANPETPVTFVTPVGPQMTLVLDEVLRFIRIKYPVWEADRVELTFDDRISKKDGPSIGAALGTMLLSMLEGFEIDPKLAITGDVSADGRIRAIGGAVAKIRAGANGAGAEIVALPADNYNQVVDGLVYEGPTLLSKIQVIGIASLDDAAATARVDRNVKLAEAIKLFGEVQEALKKSPGELKGKPVREKLTQVTALAPNHFSAKLLLLASQDKQPRKLSAAATLYYTSVAVRGVWPALQQQAWATDRNRVTPAAVKDGIKTLDKLRWIADPTMQPLVDAYRDFIRAVDNLQTGGGSVETLRAKIRAISDAETKVNSNRDVMEKMIKEGV